MAHQSAETTWLTAEERRAWSSLLALTQVLPSMLDMQLKRDAGINCFEYYVLASLSETRDHRLAMSALAALAQGSLSRLSHAVARLEHSGWVHRRPCPDDARTTEAELTAAGWEQIQKIAPSHVAEVRRLVIDVLTPSQLAQICDAAQLIIEVAAPGWLDPERGVVGNR